MNLTQEERLKRLFGNYITRIDLLRTMHRLEQMGTDHFMNRLDEVTRKVEIDLAEIEELEAKTAPESTAGFLD